MSASLLSNLLSNTVTGNASAINGLTPGSTTPNRATRSGIDLSAALNNSAVNVGGDLQEIQGSPPNSLVANDPSLSARASTVSGVTDGSGFNGASAILSRTTAGILNSNIDVGGDVVKIDASGNSTGLADLSSSASSNGTSSAEATTADSAASVTDLTSVGLQGSRVNIGRDAATLLFSGSATGSASATGVTVGSVAGTPSNADPSGIDGPNSILNLNVRGLSPLSSYFQQPVDPFFAEFGGLMDGSGATVNQTGITDGSGNSVLIGRNGSIDATAEALGSSSAANVTGDTNAFGSVFSAGATLLGDLRIGEQGNVNGSSRVGFSSADEAELAQTGRINLDNALATSSTTTTGSSSAVNNLLSVGLGTAAVQVQTTSPAPTAPTAPIELSAIRDGNGTGGFAINGIATYDTAGASLSNAGDVNGDGIDDLLIGADGANASGQAYVVFGSTNAVTSPIELSAIENGIGGFAINGIADYDSAGSSVSNAGDVNGDGIDDLLIGADRADPNGANSGQAYVVFGSTNAVTSPIELSAIAAGTGGFAINGIAAGDNAGSSVSNAGDVNGDGIDDLLIGAEEADPNGVDSGQVYVVFGSTNAVTSPIELSAIAAGTGGFAINGIAAEDYAGSRVSNAGDVNGDGIDDLLIGVEEADPNGAESGQVYVVFGSSNAVTSPIELSAIAAGTGGFAINGIATRDRAGSSVSNAGDVNGDGIDDLLIGADGADPNGGGSGQAYVVFGSSNAVTSPIELSAIAAGTGGFAINGITSYDLAGRSVSNAGDVNGDGIDDLLIGARSSPNGERSGQAYVVFGSTNAVTSPIELSAIEAGTGGFVLNGITAEDGAGFSVSNAGDVNGDGIDDLLIGAYGADPNGSLSGQVYVVFGSGSTVTSTAAAPPAEIAIGSSGDITTAARTVATADSSSVTGDVVAFSGGLTSKGGNTFAFDPFSILDSARSLGLDITSAQQAGLADQGNALTIGIFNADITGGGSLSDSGDTNNVFADGLSYLTADANTTTGSVRSGSSAITAGILGADLSSGTLANTLLTLGSNGSVRTLVDAMSDSGGSTVSGDSSTANASTATGIFNVTLDLGNDVNLDLSTASSDVVSSRTITGNAAASSAISTTGIFNSDVNIGRDGGVSAVAQAENAVAAQAVTGNSTSNSFANVVATENTPIAIGGNGSLDVSASLASSAGVMA